MDQYEQKLKQYIQEHHIQAEHLSFDQSCHSVEEAAAAVGGQPEDFVKNICFFDPNGNFIVAIVKGEDRVSRERVAAALSVPKVRMATPEEILKTCGYPCGGTPSFSFPAIFLVDERVIAKDVIYSGGGSEHALVKIQPSELLRINNGRVVHIRQ